MRVLRRGTVQKIGLGCFVAGLMVTFYVLNEERDVDKNVKM